MAPPTGDEAAYIAFDQGQYLTALKLADEGVKRNDPQSHTLLGRLYAEGLGVSKEPQTAAKWYARGDELGDIQATFALGVLYAEGRGVKKDRAKSAELFEKAARTGHPLANYNLGLLFLKGDGKPQNEYRAAMHIRYAAEKGIAVAQYDLAGLYQNGSGREAERRSMRRAGCARRPSRAWRKRSSTTPYVLLRGLGLTKDEPKAIPYLRSAAQKGLAGGAEPPCLRLCRGRRRQEKPAGSGQVAAHRAGRRPQGCRSSMPLVAKLPKAQQVAAQQAASEWREKAGLF